MHDDDENEREHHEEELEMRRFWSSLRARWGSITV